MNSRLVNILLIIIAVALGGWYFSQQETKKEPNLENLIKKEGEAEYVGDKMKTEVFDLEGKPQYLAEAESIKRYESTERVEFVKPLLNLFDAETALKKWKLSSENAEITKDKVLHLTGGVKLESLDPASKLQKIETDHLSVNLKTHDIFTDAEVSATGLGFTTSGKGLEGNLKKQVAKLKENVKSYIEPETFRKAKESEKPEQKNESESENKDK